MSGNELIITEITDKLNQMVEASMKLRDANKADIMAFKIREYSNELRKQRDEIMKDIWQKKGALKNVPELFHKDKCENCRFWQRNPHGGEWGECQGYEMSETILMEGQGFEKMRTRENHYCKDFKLK